jgi:ERCC4-related helicase
MFPESTRKIAAELDKKQIRYCVMQGTRTQRDVCVRQFRGDVNVMLLTSAQNCAGLNLPFVSHIIFYHKLIDLDVEAQVAARGQRGTRDHNLEVIFLLNQAEDK